MGLYTAIDKAIKWLSHKHYKRKITGSVDTLSLKGHILIQAPEKITVGANCCFNDGVQIHAGEGITLGNNVTISMGAKLITRSYETNNWREQCQKIETDMTHYEKPI